MSSSSMPPELRPEQTNPSIPSVFADLALEHVREHGRLEPRQIQALVRHGERESVDLLGPVNRARCIDFYRSQNAFLGSLVGRASFFEDLNAMATVAPTTLAVDEARDRYRQVFDALVGSPDVYALRRDCQLLESLGHDDAAAALFDHHHGALTPESISWFRDDLETCSDGRLTIINGGYRSTSADSRTTNSAKRLARGARRRAGATVRRLRPGGPA